jgi:hypothetical protein
MWSGEAMHANGNLQYGLACRQPQSNRFCPQTKWFCPQTECLAIGQRCKPIAFLPVLVEAIRSWSIANCLTCQTVCKQFATQTIQTQSVWDQTEPFAYKWFSVQTAYASSLYQTDHIRKWSDQLKPFAYTMFGTASVCDVPYLSQYKQKNPFV